MNAKHGRDVEVMPPGTVLVCYLWGSLCRWLYAGPGQVRRDRRFERGFTLAPDIKRCTMALWDDRIALVNTHENTLAVFDLDGVQLCRFGTSGAGPGPGEFFPPIVYAHTPTATCWCWSLATHACRK